MYHSSHNTRYIAECVSKGTKLIIIQHGGRYGSLKNLAHEEHEIEVSDYFLSWYKKNKVRNLDENKGSIKSIGFANK